MNETGAYITGVAIGDGNISNWSGKIQKLRITCDDKYPKLQKRIMDSLEMLFPMNKVSMYHRRQNCTDIYVHWNDLESFLGWKAGGGSNYEQGSRIHICKLHYDYSRSLYRCKDNDIYARIPSYKSLFQTREWHVEVCNAYRKTFVRVY